MVQYKFKEWTKHSNGDVVTDEERSKRAEEIAKLLCDNSRWLSHGSHITREMAIDTCKLQITFPESIEGLDRAIRRFWALMRLILENNTIAKIYATGDYFLFKGINLNPNQTEKNRK